MPSPERLIARVSRPGFTSALGSLVPSAAFLLFDAWFGLVAAMVAASGTGVVSLILRRKRSVGLGILLPVSLGFVVVKAVAGVLTESQVVYFGAGLALSALFSIAIGATAFTKHPVASYAMPLVTPYEHLSLAHPVYRRVAAQVTAVWAFAELGITGWEAWHLTSSSASEFVAIWSLVASPVMGVVIFFLIFYVRFRLDRHEYRLASRVRYSVGPRID